jgi:hypothetical protein
VFSGAWPDAPRWAIMSGCFDIFVGARVAPSTGEAGWSLPLSLALLARLILTGIVQSDIPFAVEAVKGICDA